LLAIQANKVNATIDQVFGDDTAEAKEFRVDPILAFGDFYVATWDELVKNFNRGRDRAIASISAAIDGLQERLADEDESADSRLLRAYERLALRDCPLGE
jgi:hypothetical protein